MHLRHWCRAALVAAAIAGSLACAAAVVQPPRATPTAPPHAATAWHATGADAVDLVIQGAVDSELQPLLAALEGKEEIQLAAWTFWRGTLAGRRVVISRTEVGPANAAASTTLAITQFRPALIINQGTAGAIDPTLAVFDIVVGEATVDYGAFQSAHADLGAGVSQARWRPMPHRIRLDGKERAEYWRFLGDPAAARDALSTPNPRGRVVTGVIGSAFEFNRELDRLTWVRQAYGASSEDMESAFSAAVAQGFGTRFLAIRIISDNEFTAPEFQRIAGEYCATFVVDMLKRTAGR